MTKVLVDTATFAIDYPNDGPSDIYALGVPKQTAILDHRAMEKFFEPRKIPKPADYDATVFATWTGRHLLKAAQDVKRHRHNAAGTLIEQTDYAKWFDFLVQNNNQKQSIQWWVDEISRASMEPFTPNTSGDLLHEKLWFGRRHSVNNGMKTIMYRGGRPSDFVSIHTEGTIEGLQGTIELRGPKRSVWLDPERDHILVRKEREGETADEYDPIHVTQFDEVQQGPNGVWFPRRWRRGRVKQRGEELDNSFRGSGVINTRLWVAEVTFPEFAQQQN